MPSPNSLKKERIKKQAYKNRELPIADVADYLDTFYNGPRRHSHLDGLSPEQFEAASRTAPTESLLNPGNSTAQIGRQPGSASAPSSSRRSCASSVLPSMNARAAAGGTGPRPLT